MDQQFTVHDVMTADPIAVQTHEDLDRAWTLMTDYQIRHLPVVDEAGQLIGLVSHRDLVAESRYPKIPGSEEPQQPPTVGEVMHELVASAEPEQDIREAAELMFRGKFGCLPVVDGDRTLVGILTEADFVRLFAQGQ